MLGRSSLQPESIATAPWIEQLQLVEQTAAVQLEQSISAHRVQALPPCIGHISCMLHSCHCHQHQTCSPCPKSRSERDLGTRTSRFNRPDRTVSGICVVGHELCGRHACPCDLMLPHRPRGPAYLLATHPPNRPLSQNCVTCRNVRRSFHKLRSGWMVIRFLSSAQRSTPPTPSTQPLRPRRNRRQHIR